MNTDLDHISQELLLALFNYDPETGIFTRKLTTGTKAKKGDIAGVLNDNGYIDISINTRAYRAHRLAWLYCFDELPEEQIDHIDNDRTNNRLDNLRLATNLQNSYNKGVSKLNTTGYKGVSLDKRCNRYRAYISVEGKQKSLGYYSTAEEASQAYIDAAKKLHKDFYNENTI